MSFRRFELRICPGVVVVIKSNTGYCMRREFVHGRWVTSKIRFSSIPKRFRDVVPVHRQPLEFRLLSFLERYPGEWFSIGFLAEWFCVSRVFISKNMSRGLRSGGFRRKANGNSVDYQVVG